MADIITSNEMQFNENALYHFRKKVTVNSILKSTLNIFAEARYKLYINGCLVAVGPCKGSFTLKYYDKVDITDYLKKGENLIEVSVLQLVSLSHVYEYSHLTSVVREGGMVLSVWGNAGDTELQTDQSWLCAKEKDWELIRPKHSFYVGMNEKIGKSFGKNLVFENAKVLRKIQSLDNPNATFTEMSPWPVRKRTIPMMYFNECSFEAEKDGVYDSGKLVCGYVRVRLSGKGKAILTYAESKTIKKDGKLIKQRRDDENGIVEGDYDIIEVDGSCNFESWWFRTFRYIKVELEGVRIESIDYIDSGYPLEVSDEYDFGNETDNRLFEISLNTLRRCMHESYEDCPYYEQLQYAMDTHLQMLFTYQLTNDDRLARKAIDDFACSYVCGSITQSRFPSLKPQFITGFSLFFIFMLYEHAKRFSDFEFISKYIHIADGIIEWFLQRLEGDMVKRSNFWDFIDWAEGFDYGQQPTRSPSTVYSLMLAKAIEDTQWLYNMTGGSKRKYAELPQRIKSAVKEKCYNKDTGLFADSTEMSFYSQHSQIWAVLCGLVENDDASELLKRAEKLKCKATYAYMFYLFRAMEKAGLYDEVNGVIDSLRELTKLGCTTLPEIPGENSRSECHAWSAVVLYEFTAKVLGITNQDGKICICPHINGRKYAKGEVAVSGGMVKCQWQIEGNMFTLVVDMPEGKKADIVLPDGTVLNNKESGKYFCEL